MVDVSLRWHPTAHEVTLARNAAPGGAAVAPRVQDDDSRQIMTTRVALNENSTDAWACVQPAIGRQGPRRWS